MLRLMMGVALLLALVAGLWLGAETWAARRAAALIAEAPEVDAAAVTPLRRLDAFGLRVEAPAVTGAGLALELPHAELSLAPTAPRTLRLTLPGEGRLRTGAGDVALAATAPEASATVAPLRDMAIDAAHLSLRDLRLDGRAAAETLQIDARLRRLGHDAPRPARAAYDLALEAAGIAPEALALGGLDAAALPGPLAATGALRVWLDDAPRLQQGARRPQLAGFETQGFDLATGDLQIRIVGRLGADASGLAEGRLAVFTRDGEAIIRQLVALEIIPAAAALLVRAGLTQLGSTDFPEAAGPLSGPAIPAPAEGELRLPLTFAGGQVSLGAIPLGPAPRLLR